MNTNINEILKGSNLQELFRDVLNRVIESLKTRIESTIRYYGNGDITDEEKHRFDELYKGRNRTNSEYAEFYFLRALIELGLTRTEANDYSMILSREDQKKELSFEEKCRINTYIYVANKKLTRKEARKLYDLRLKEKEGNLTELERKSLNKLLTKALTTSQTKEKLRKKKGLRK